MFASDIAITSFRKRKRAPSTNCVVLWQLDYVVNALLSINVIVAFMAAFILDNTVPGTREERGMYKWSKVETAGNESILLEEYALPKRIGKFFRWAKCLGT